MGKARFKGKQPKDLPPVMKRAVGNALDEVVPVLDRQFTEEIQTVKWGWPNITQRKNGNEANYVRDIVDLGDLKRSQQNRRINDYHHRWVWDVEYSSVVHNGATLKGGGKILDRPWTKTAEQVIKPGDFVSDIIRRELNG